ncbi:MAG: hypothetical protein GC192_15885 [Bacteroidetes bacterium]|nr:hypothetical protein [Bacteroidota bacterium]
MSIAAQLKSDTFELHQQTEAMMPSVALMDGSLSQAEYAQLISSLYRIHFKIEFFLENALIKYPELAAFFHKKLPWLKADLAEMGVETPTVSSNIPVPPHGEAALMGMIYVLEGATLGGQVILKGLKKNAALQHFNNRYYSGYEQLTGARWKSFLENLEATVPPKSAAKAVEGAKFVFRLFQEYLPKMVVYN